MSSEENPGTFDPNSIRKVMTVNASQAIAWRVFTTGMSSWWPLAQYKIGRTNAVAAVVEPFAHHPRASEASPATAGPSCARALTPSRSSEP
jgi:hypothetical protein